MSRLDQSFVPRYHEIEQALRARLQTLAPGDTLPSDSMLCAEFAVSRMTARNAMQRLAQEGLVDRVPGRGTFVAEPPAHRRADNLVSFSDEMRRRGRLPSSDVLDYGVRPATAAETSALRLRDGSDVVALRRIRRADDEPIAVEATILREDCAAAVAAADPRHDSLHAILVAANLRPTHGRATLGAAVATPEDARLLAVAEGSALLVETRVIVDQHGRPLERTESRYAAGRYALDVDFDVEQAMEPSRRTNGHDDRRRRSEPEGDPA